MACQRVPSKSLMMMARQYKSRGWGLRPSEKVMLATHSSLCTRLLMLPGCMVPDKPVFACCPPCGMRHNGSFMRGTLTNNTAASGSTANSDEAAQRSASRKPRPPADTARHTAAAVSAASSQRPVSRLWLNSTAEPIRNNIASRSTFQSRCELLSKALSVTNSSRNATPPSRPNTVPSCVQTNTPDNTPSRANTGAGSLPIPAYSSAPRTASRAANSRTTAVGSEKTSGRAAQSRAANTVSAVRGGGGADKKAKREDMEAMCGNGYFDWAVF